MRTNDDVAAVLDDVIAWQRHLHRNPELGFEETATADFIARKLEDFGLEVHRDISETCVLGVLRAGTSDRTVIFRAELDALPIPENTGLAHASEVEGVMHACGHDAHSAILLGAARVLAQAPAFDGTVCFLFQAAEEVLGGGRKLVADGFLDRFPADAVFSVHNWPGFAEGHVAVATGPMMAAVDDFTVSFQGTGCHAAMPDLGDDPVLAAAEFVSSAQRIVSRTRNPQSALVLSFTQIHGGSINNIVPGKVDVQGTARFFDPAFSGHCAEQLGRIAEGIASAHGLACELDYRRGYPAVINTSGGAELAALAAGGFLPEARVEKDLPPSMGCEDFSYLLNAVGEGAYVWLGAGEVGPGEGLHGDRYVFNENLFPIGIRFWQALAARALPPR